MTKGNTATGFLDRVKSLSLLAVPVRGKLKRMKDWMNGMQLSTACPKIQTDVMVSRRNKTLTKSSSKFKEPRSRVTDAFVLPWNFGMVYHPSSMAHARQYCRRLPNLQESSSL